MSELRYRGPSPTGGGPAAGSLAAVSFMGTEEIGAVRRFHQSLPQYRITPLAMLDGLAEELGVGHVMVKDEASRFGLGAFKGLGGIYAMACSLAERVGVDTEVGFPRLRQIVSDRLDGDVTFVTATAANHGRGVAWSARLFGCSAVVYMPRGTAVEAVEAIRDQGARVEIEGDGFEEVVERARDAADRHGWVLLQDTAWDGYETVPRWIMQGYGTMVLEALEQVAAEGLDSPTHVFLQVGVGSFAAAVTACMVSLHRRRRPATFTVEPTGAAPLYASVEAKRRSRLDACEPTVMSCLACSEVSSLAWPVLRDWSAGHFTCGDDVTALGQRLLAEPLGDDPRVVSGPSGAVGAGVLATLCLSSGERDLKRKLRLDRGSRILLFSTEGNPSKKWKTRDLESSSMGESA